MKEKIALITDSTCDIPSNILKEKNIHSLPLKIIYTNQQYNDRIDIQPEEIYRRFPQEIPTTSMPSPYDAKRKILELKEEGFTHILAIHISKGLSGTYNMVNMLSKEIENIQIKVIDSQALSMGLGRLVLYATELIEQRIKFNDIVKKIENKINSIDTYFIVDNLKYLIEGGRIGKVAGTIGTLLNVKPIISIDENGEYYTFKKIRGRKKSISTLYNLVEARLADGLHSIDVLHGDAHDEAYDLFKKFKKLDNITNSIFGQISPSMVVHTGPGLIGVVVNKIKK